MNASQKSLGSRFFMSVRGRAIVLASLLSACLRSPGPSPVPREDDPSIVFPHFFEQDAIRIGAENAPYELDGEMLRAMMVVASDFVPEADNRQSCLGAQAVQYRVIRQGEVFFVYAYRDLTLCGLSYAVADSGAKYAISADGRILRRVVDGQPMEPVNPDTPDAGRPGDLAELGTSAVFDAGWNLDGGPPGEPVLDGGTPGVP